MPSHLITQYSRLPALEGWRGVVSLVVLMYHFWPFFSNQPVMPYGYLGIDFFFILFGFILSRQYEAAIATRRINFYAFAVRRLSRIYPLYLVSIGLFLWINYAYVTPFYQEHDPSVIILDVGMGPDLAWHVLLQLLMLGNVAGMVMPWNGPAWLVSVVWTVGLLFFCMAWQWRRIPTLAWVAFVFCCTVYLVDFSPQSLNLVAAEPAFFNPTIARGLLGFSLGALLFRYHHSLPRLSWAVLHLVDVLLISAVLLLASHFSSSFVIGLDYVFVFAIFPPLLIISLYRKSWIGRILSLPFFTLLGKISYSVYLLHFPLGYLVQYAPYVQDLELTKPTIGVFYLAVVLVVSMLSYLFIEKPCRALGRRLLKKA